MNNQQNRFYTPKPTKFVGFQFNQNQDKLGRQTVGEIKEDRIRFNQKIKNEGLFKPKEIKINTEEKKDSRDYLSSLRNLNKK